MTGKSRTLALMLAAAAALAACAEKHAAPPPPPKPAMARLSNAVGVYSGTDIHCLDGIETQSLLGLSLPAGPHRVVASYSVCGVDRPCADYFGQFEFTAVAGAKYLVEGDLDGKTNKAALTVLDAGSNAAVAGPFPAERNVLAEDPKHHFGCAPKAPG
jgi:hypothetical protein